MQWFNFTRRAALIVALVAAVLAAPAHATISFIGNVSNASETPPTGATFAADLTYSFSSAITATLTIDITNTTPAPIGGRLTAFVLNNPGDNITGSTLSTAPATWTQLGLGDINGAPFGHFDLGASSTGDFEGGGNPNTGLAVGATGHFVFDLTGSGLDNLTETSFLNELSVPPGDGKGLQFFVARFKALDIPLDGSDKVPGIIPEPSTYAMLLGGLALVAFGMRRRPN